MKRTYEWDSWVIERRSRASAVARLAQTPRHERLRGRTRSSEEYEMLRHSAVAAVARREAEGRFVRLGPRRYELWSRRQRYATSRFPDADCAVRHRAVQAPEQPNRYPRG